MSETLHARQQFSSPGANLGPKKVWKKAKQKPYIDDHRRDYAPAWSSHSTPSYKSDGGQLEVSPSLIDRLGPKVVQPRSLLERMEPEDSEMMEAADTGVVDSFGPNCMPSGAVPYYKVGREEDGQISDVDAPFDSAFEDGEIKAGRRPGSLLSRGRPSWNGVPTNGQSHQRASSRPTDHWHDRNTSRNANFERARGNPTSEPAVVDSNNNNHNNFRDAAPESRPMQNHAALDTPFADSDLGPASDASSSRSRPPLPLQARIGRALRSAVVQNATLREKNETLVTDRLQSKIDELVTNNRAESFGAQMRKVKHEMDALRAGRQTEEVMARAKDELLNGFGSKSGIGGYTDNTWLSRRDSHSLIPSLASTSILPTPPPSETLPAEEMIKPPPKAPRAMISLYSPNLPPKSTSLKGKEKAVDPLENDRGTPRERRNSYTDIRTERMLSDDVPLNTRRQERSPSYRRASVSPLRSAHMRSFADEMPTYRSPHTSRTRRSPPPRTSSLPRSPTMRSPVRRSRSRSLPRSAVSHTRSFDSRRPPFRSPSRSRSPPPSASYNGYPRRARSRDSSRGRTFSGKRPPPYYTPRSYSRSRSPILTSRHPYEKRPFVRSPSPYHDSNHPRSPPPRRRKLSHRSRSPSVGGGRRARHSSADASRGVYADPPRRPYPDSPQRAYVKSPSALQSPFGAHPPSAPVPDTSPAPPPPPAPSNPCNIVPNLWFVKVGADAPKIVEGAFVIEPSVAETWGIVPSSSSSNPSGPPWPARPPNSALCVELLCVPTAALIALSHTLRADARPTPESMAAAVAGLETAWPRSGTLILDMNKDTDANEKENGTGRGKTWLPLDINPSAPLDVTAYLRPGRNMIRFIQLAGMEDHTFILCAARRDTKPVNSIHKVHADLDLVFENWPTAGENPLFKFSATVSVS